MIAEHREYTFDEWNSLTFEQQREIVNHYWNPYEPELGKLTRERIIEAFCDRVNSELEFCEYRFLDFMLKPSLPFQRNLKQNYQRHLQD